MATRFRNINIGKILYEGLRAYYSVNTDGFISILFKFCFALVQPLQAPFDALDIQRTINAIVANCKWEIGQLANVLNYLYDNTLNRIFITQSVPSIVSATTFDYTAILNAGEFGDNPVQLRGFFDKTASSPVIINVPAGTNIASITAVIEQIRIQGIAYQIVEFTPPTPGFPFTLPFTLS